MQNPQTRYVQRGEVSIAYQVVGARGPDLIIVPGFIFSSLDPREHLGARDRVLVQIARRAPAVLRVGVRLGRSKREAL